MSKPNTRAIIDANIRQNGQQLITGQVLNATLNAMVTDYAEQAALDGLKEKVDALALGAFYGYFPDSDSLPTDVTTPGYAYVGSDNPYEIWNFNGEAWSDSGTSIDQNDADEEDITRNADGKLQFKDRSYGDGMGYVILRKDKTFAEQVTEDNTIYEIRYDFSVGTFSMPGNCCLFFNGGKLENGSLQGNSTKCIGDIKFKNVIFSGSFKNNILLSRYFVELSAVIFESITNSFAVTDFYITEDMSIADASVRINGAASKYLCIHGNGHQLTINKIQVIRAFEIKDCKIVCAGELTSGYRIDCRGGMRMQGCSMTGVDGSALYCQDYYAYIKENTFEGLYEGGAIDAPKNPSLFINLASCYDNIVVNNKITNVKGLALKIASMAGDPNVQITDNHIEMVAAGGIVLQTSRSKRVNISRNYLCDINYHWLSTPSATGLGDVNSGINTHGTQHGLVCDNTIIRCYGFSIDINGTDQAYYDQYLSDHPDATPEQLALAFQNRGLDTTISGNTIKASVGIIVSNNYACHVVNNHFDGVYNLTDYGGLTIVDSTEVYVNDNIIRYCSYSDFVEGTFTNSSPVVIRTYNNSPVENIVSPMYFRNNVFQNDLNANISIRMYYKNGTKEYECVQLYLKGNSFNSSKRSSGYAKFPFSLWSHVINEDEIRHTWTRIPINDTGFRFIPNSDEYVIKQVNLYGSNTAYPITFTLSMPNNADKVWDGAIALADGTRMEKKPSAEGYKVGDSISWFTLTSTYTGDARWVDVEIILEPKRFHRYY